MQERPDRTGRMPYRLWYEEVEIDAIMESEFEKAGAPVLSGTAAVDIDAFVEEYLGIVPDFVTLQDGIQGATEFYSDGRVGIQIAAGLAIRADQELHAERLLRTTLAHEAAHVLLHRTLFGRASEALFGGAASHQELCRDVRFVGPGYTGEWWEWQANRGMGALLLPRTRLISEIRRRRTVSSDDPVEDVVEHVGLHFAVSRQAVRYRLEQLGIIGDPRQQALGL